MSVSLITIDQDALAWTTNLPNVEAFTVMLWCRPNLGSGVQPNIISLGINGGEGRALYIDASNQWSLWDGSAGTAGAAVSDDQWYIVCLRGNGTQLKAFYKLEGAGSWNTLTGTQTTGISENTLAIGKWVGGSDFWNGLIRGIKQWNVALSDGQVDSEATQIAPIVTSGLQRYIRLTTNTDTADQSGNGFNPTINGTLDTDAAEPTTPVTGSGVSVALAGSAVTGNVGTARADRSIGL